MRQSIKRKLKIWIHCLVRSHQLGVYQWRSESDPALHRNWVCADCAEKHVNTKPQLSKADKAWAERLINEHPEWREFQ